MKSQSLFEKAKLESAYIRAARSDSLTTQHNRCKYCYEEINAKTVTADHVKAKAKGGSNLRDNIVGACRSCNSAKGSMSDSLFANKIKHVSSGLYAIYFRRKINLALQRMQKNVMHAVGK